MSAEGARARVNGVAPLHAPTTIRATGKDCGLEHYMTVNEELLFTLETRKREVKSQIRALELVMEGREPCFESIVCPDGEYDAKATRALIRDIIGAYHAWYGAEAARANGALSYADWEYRTLYSYEPEEAKRIRANGPVRMLDKTQEGFLKSALYCLLRLMAEGSPLQFDLYHDFADAVEQLLAAFGKRTPADRFRAEYVARDALAGSGTPATTPETFPDEHLHHCVSWGGRNDGAAKSSVDFLEGLNGVYELLSGAPISSCVTKADRTRLLADPMRFSFLKDDGYVCKLNEEEARRAFKRGWVDARDMERHAAFMQERRNREAAAPFGYGDGDIGSWGAPLETEDEARAMRRKEAERLAAHSESIRRWVESFPDKDAWCKSYRSLLKGYFKLEGLSPLQEGFDENAWMDPRPIDPSVVAFAIKAVREDRGLSHYTDDVYAQAYRRLHRTVFEARRNADMRRARR